MSEHALSSTGDSDGRQIGHATSRGLQATTKQKRVLLDAPVARPTVTTDDADAKAVGDQRGERPPTTITASLVGCRG